MFNVVLHYLQVLTSTVANHISEKLFKSVNKGNKERWYVGKLVWIQRYLRLPAEYK